MSKEKNIDSISRCGYVAIIGRPNVGKSTLLNHILGQKISITSRKPQTTRHTLIGIKTEAAQQAVYIDTPGLHKKEVSAMNRYMNRSANAVLADVDVVVFVTERLQWLDEDDYVLQLLEKVQVPVILVVNKTDQLEDKQRLLPHLEALAKKRDFADIVPISALNNHNVEALEKVIGSLLPENPPFFPDDQITDRTERFLAAEIVREKITRQLGNELPYQVSVEIEKFTKQKSILHIHALIWVERDNQKAIVIGKKGARLNLIGREARIDMESLFADKVMLNLWVKVKRGWSNDERALQSLGYDKI